MTKKASRDVSDVVVSLIGDMHPHELWLRIVLEQFPLPRAEAALSFFEALLRIAQQVTWLGAAIGYDPVPRLKQVISSLQVSRAIHMSRAEAGHALTGDWVFSGTMVGSEHIPQPGADSLRAALWVCHERWHALTETRASTIKSFASAIRGAVSIVDHNAVERHGVAKYLVELGQPKSVAEFVEASAVLTKSEHRGIRDVWKHVVPELKRPPPGLPPSPVPAADAYEDMDADKRDLIVARVRRVSTPTLDPGEPLLEGEPVAEVSSTTFIAPVPASENHPEARALAEHRARQVVWTQNSALSTLHPDVLPAPVFERVIRVLLDALTSATRHELSLGLAALLLQAITGKTSKSLREIRIVGRFAADPVAPCEFSMREQAFRMRVFFWDDSGDPHGYFRPSEAQKGHLEPVVNAFLLPLPAKIVDAVRDELPRLGLSDLDVDSLDQQIRAAATYVAQVVGMPISAGQVRRSFAAHLFELCRDTALVQIVCGDTLGQSEAPLHYYAPRATDLGRVYQKLLRRLMGSDKSRPKQPSSGPRIGSRLLVHPEAAKELSGAVGRMLTKALTANSTIAQRHNAMVTYLAAMFLATTGHRPVNALFRITLGEIELESGAALFADKVHDPAHNPRLAVLPEVLVAQITAYRSHLDALRDELPALHGTVARILAGEFPLLFLLSDDSACALLSMGLFSEMLPPEWKVLPLNWGRTYIRTRGVELGLPPELAAALLGHLDAVGYPFSHVSPTEPAAFVGAVRPFLDQIVKMQGWRVRSGMGSRTSASALPVLPLRSWARHVEAHEEDAKEFYRLWRERERSEMESYKRVAQEYVLTHPDIVSEGIDDLYARGDVSGLSHGLTKDRADELCTAMIDDAAPDVAMGIARAQALYRILRIVNRRIGMVGQEPNRRIPVRRPVDNAFVPGAMTAVRQLAALRMHGDLLGREKPGCWRNFALACARTAYVLAVYGYCDNPQQIEGMLACRGQVERVGSLGAIVARWGPQAHQAVGLRGLAAIALARLAEKHPEGQAPSRSEINVNLQAFLPREMIPATRGNTLDLLGMLCETVSVANRYELSPATRMALHVEKGSVPAHPREQVALLDGHPAGTIQRDWEGAPEVQDDRVALGGPVAHLGNARSQYLAVCRLIPQQGRDLELPLTGQWVAARQVASRPTRQLVINELRALLDQSAPEVALQPVVRLLVMWMLDMLEQGTHKRRYPADRTISTYLTRIGGYLVNIFGQRSLEDLTDVELEEAYSEVIESGGYRQNRAAKAVAILSFHECCARHFVFPEPDLSQIRGYLRSSVRAVDASLTVSSERDAAVAGLLAETLPIEAASSQDSEQGRLVRQASAAMLLFAYAGARRSEVLGLRFADVASGDGLTAVRIRPNPSRTLKTPAARRTIVLSDVMGADKVAAFCTWVQADRSRLNRWRDENNFVFSQVADGRSASGRSKIAETCIRALADVTRRERDRLHRLRHLVAFELFTPIVLSDRDYETLSKQPLCLASPTRPAVPLPRDWVGPAARMGHAQANTALQSYLHVPWLLRSRADDAIQEKFLTPHTAAFALGVTRAMAYKIARMGKLGAPESLSGTAPNFPWLDHVHPSTHLPRRDANVTVAPSQPPRSWTAAELGGLLKHVENTRSLRQAVHVTGARAEEAKRIRRECRIVEIRLGRRIIAEKQLPDLDTPRRIARNLREAQCLEAWWDRYDSGSDEERATLVRLATQVCDHMTPKDGDVIKVDSKTGTELANLLESTFPKAPIERMPLPLGMEAIRAARPGDSDRGRENQRYLGIAVKRALSVIWLAERLQHDALADR